MLIHGGFMWTRKNERKDGVTVWRCSCRVSAACGALLWTTKDAAGNMTNVNSTDHSNDSNADALIRIRADSAVRASAVVSVDNTQNLIAEVVTALPVQEHVALNERRLRRTVYAAKMRARKLAGEEDGVYTSLQELVLPSKMLENRGVSILIGDTGPHEERILCFGVERHFQLLEETSVVLGDGTFHSDELWTQQHSLHVLLQRFTIPVLFFVVPGKTKTLYSRLLHIVVDLVPGVVGKTWLFDFEAGMISAHKELMPDGVSAGCFFICQSPCTEKSNPWDGDKRTQKMQHSDVALLLCPHWHNLPVDFVSRAFDLLQREFPLEASSIPEYFEATYIGTNRPTSTHPNEIPSRPILPPVFCTVSSRQQMGPPSTTNALERFQLNQQHCLHHVSHPSVPIFVHDLHRQIALGDLHLAQVRAGDRRVPSNLLARKREKYASILVSLNEHNIMMVLTQLTHVRFNTSEVVSGAFRVLSLNATGEPPSSLPASSMDRPSEVPVASSSRFEESQASIESISRVLPSSSAIEERPAQIPLASSSTVEEVVDPQNTIVTEFPRLQVVLPGRVPPIVVADVAQWLVWVGYSQGRHGPHNVEKLQETIGKVTQSRVTVTANRTRGWWIFQHSKRQCICQGCRGVLCRGLPRLSWDQKL